MTTEVPSQQELYDNFRTEIQNRTSELTDFREGSNLDAIAGASSVVGQELSRLFIKLFAKTFIGTANGPEITGGPDDLQTLLTDHFGEGFARPGATSATGVVTFSRPNTAAGNVVIPQGTIVKTEKDADGNEQRFATEIAVTMTGTTIDASVVAVVGGSAGNAQSGTVVVIESALTDSSVVVTNSTSFVGGDDNFDDSEYREFARNKIETIRGATCLAVEAAAANVAGVETSTVIEDVIDVIGWDIGGNTTTGDPFKISRARLFVADVNGTASDALINDVDEAVDVVRACGVQIEVFGAVALPVDWTVTIVLNPGGPNFTELSSDTTRIEETMAQYIRDLPIGTGFNRSLGKQAILAVWGPTGTNDLTDVIVSVPSGNISATETQKLIPNTMEASS